MILLKTSNEEKEGWHYLAVKKLSELVRGIILKNNCNFYCLNCLYLFKTEKKLGCQGQVCKNKLIL